MSWREDEAAACRNELDAAEDYMSSTFGDPDQVDPEDEYPNDYRPIGECCARCRHAHCVTAEDAWAIIGLLGPHCKINDYSGLKKSLQENLVVCASNGMMGHIFQLHEDWDCKWFEEGPNEV